MLHISVNSYHYRFTGDSFIEVLWKKKNNKKTTGFAKMVHDFLGPAINIFAIKQMHMNSNSLDPEVLPFMGKFLLTQLWCIQTVKAYLSHRCLSMPQAMFLHVNAQISIEKVAKKGLKPFLYLATDHKHVNRLMQHFKMK